MTSEPGIRYHARSETPAMGWSGPADAMAFDTQSQQACLWNLERPCYVVRRNGEIGITHDGYPYASGERPPGAVALLGSAPPLPIQNLGDPTFRSVHRVQAAYASGAMANGIASEALVVAMGGAGFLSSFGAAGLLPDRIEKAIHHVQHALPQGPYAFNLIHSPNEPALEQAAVSLYVQRGVTTIEASAYLDLTPHIVYYRAAGLGLTSDQRIEIRHRVIAKLSRREVATKFLRPAPSNLLPDLVSRRLITEQQAQLAAHVPMADDITVEADSGGHTDNRPLVCLLPSILALRDDIQAEYAYPQPVRIGAAGGIATPASALAAFMMGAAYVVTGSINQACREAAVSPHTKRLLAQAEMADVAMAPAADMFELGVKLQVLKRGTFFPMNAQKLYDLYRVHDAIEDLPPLERERLERRVFKTDLDSIWQQTQAYFAERDPSQITRARGNPKRKMALIFRWYLGLSSHWSNTGEPDRETDYQIWCGPAMGAFNDWVRGSYLEAPAARHVADIAWQIMRGAAVLYRLQSLKMQGLALPHTAVSPFVGTRPPVSAPPS